MIWLHPLAWLAAAAIAVPILVHLLARRRAERIPFPTLRFIQRTRLPAMRRRAIEDLALLAVRAAIVILAVAACAGPLLVTSVRQAGWQARLVRAVVVAEPPTQSFGERRRNSPDQRTREGGSSPIEDAGQPVVASREFETRALPDGIRRAVAWLETAPPARRELVVAAPLTIGSLNSADLAAVPGDVGIRFVRAGHLPAGGSVEASPLVTATGVLRRLVTLDGAGTGVHEERGTTSSGWPIEIIAPPPLQRTADAALVAVLSVRVRVTPPDRRARLVFLEGPDIGTAGSATPIHVPWIGDAVARIARDAALQEEAARIPSGFPDGPVARPPWHVIARAADGGPLVAAAASSDTLLVVSTARAGDLVVPTLLRAVAIGLAPEEDLSAAEILPIADSQLRAWSRAPRPLSAPRPENVERDDRRWLWGAVLLLIGVETVQRRSRRDLATTTEEARARVA